MCTRVDKPGMRVMKAEERERQILKYSSEMVVHCYLRGCETPGIDPDQYPCVDTLLRCQRWLKCFISSGALSALARVSNKCTWLVIMTQA
jgi:hypothetical protein